MSERFMEAVQHFNAVIFGQGSISLQTQSFLSLLSDIINIVNNNELFCPRRPGLLTIPLSVYISDFNI
jgi:hypothetical protein